MPTPPSPVPASPDGPPPKKGLSKTAIILLVIGGVFVFLCIAGFIEAVAVVVPRMQEKQKRFTCEQNLQQLAQIFAATRSENGPEPRSGPALFLAWRKEGRIIKEGQEAIFVCLGDPATAAPNSPGARARYDEADLDGPLGDLCSYAARDFVRFPLARKSPKAQPIAACLHHKDGAMIAFEDGSVRFFTREELGVGSDTEMTVGPDSPAELLRPLTFGPSAK
jgi:hypothetical protein